MNVFEAKYNTKIDIYSSGAKSGEKLKELYPKLHVENQLKSNYYGIRIFKEIRRIL